MRNDLKRKGVNMKRKILLVLLILVFALSLTLVACNNGKGSFEFDPYQDSGNSGGSNAIVLPTDIPATASEPSVQIHYHRNNSADYTTWEFWIWQQGGGGKEYKLNYQDDNGGVAVYPLSAFGNDAINQGIGIIPRTPNWAQKDCDDDRMVNFADYTMDANNYYHIYLTQGDKNLYKDITTMKYSMSAAFASESQIAIKTKEPIKSVKIYEGDQLIAESATEATISVRYNLPKNKTPDLIKGYTVEVAFANSDITAKEKVGVTVLYATDAFNKSFYYDGELGAIYSTANTTFKVWSPVSTRIVLNIYNSGHLNETPTTHEMAKGDKGVFAVTVQGDLEAKYYTYTVFNGNYPLGKEIVDPYAKSAGLHGMRGQIVDFSKTNPTGWDNVTPKAYDRKELVVWETHVADVTSSATWTGSEANRKKFLGMIEEGTTYTQGARTVKTGFNHIKELGVNAVQLVPIFDQANDEENVKFNWGYNPLNYNVLEGAYSSDATDGYARIREFKQLVQKFNGANMNIIMDVVYNHVSSSASSNFEVLMPGYYFRYNADGTAANGSGCGNETASDHKMFRKFMIDSVCFWAKEYKLGGFRFDLMGLHDIETMNLLDAELKKINPNIVVYGEPWEGGTSALPQAQQADQSNGNKLQVGQFNDQMRDALIKGGMNDARNVGWVTDMGNPDKGCVKQIITGLKGGVELGNNSILDPNKVLNYVTCHDNYTLYDRIVATGIEPSEWELIQNMAILANSVVLTSNGTTFILAGEEFLRTKNVDGATKDEVHNSYESSYKVNELDYALKVRNYDVFEIYKQLVSFKVTCSGLHLNQNEIEANYKVEQLAGGSAIQIVITDSKNNRTYKVVHANGSLGSLNVDFAGYTLYLDTLSTDITLSASTSISPFQTIIAYK